MSTYWYFYVIESLNSCYRYKGITQDPEKRLLLHNRGSTRSTKPYRPFKLVYLEKLGDDRKQARLMEKYYKSGSGREKLDCILSKNRSLV